MSVVNRRLHKNPPVDPVQAAAWFSKAAEQGNVDAQASLAALYKVGLGVQLDLIQSYRWYRLSERNSADRSAQLRELAGKMSSEQIADAERTSTQWRPEHGSSEAESTVSGFDLLD